jgi:hypothetical protein
LAKNAKLSSKAADEELTRLWKGMKTATKQPYKDQLQMLQERFAAYRKVKDSLPSTSVPSVSSSSPVIRVMDDGPGLEMDIRGISFCNLDHNEPYQF